MVARFSQGVGAGALTRGIVDRSGVGDASSSGDVAAGGGGGASASGSGSSETAAGGGDVCGAAADADK